MALGGGTFTLQNKVLPGSYINFISAARASSTLSERGVAAFPILLDWGVEREIFTVKAKDLERHSLRMFGYPYDHEKLKGIRDLFRNSHTAYLYRLNSGTKAANTFATALYGGIRGNSLKTVITVNLDDPEKFDVTTLLDATVVDTQTVATMDELTANEYVEWKRDAELAETAGTPFTGGSNGAEPTGEVYQQFLDTIESHQFNALGCPARDPMIKSLFVAFTKRMRDKVGAKFQTVVYRSPADYEGVISVENQVLEEGVPEQSLVYWVTGAAAGCAVNQSNTNKRYDGEYMVDVPFTQQALEDALRAGKFVFHKVGDEIRVLEDINSLTTYTDEKNSDFSSNQTIRVLDQIANDIAVLFNNKYLGKIPNNESGRVSFWNDVVSHHKELETLQAIENFNADDVLVSQGEGKKAVVVSDRVTVVNSMSQLYMTVTVY
ncbi:phage tail sheath family protein [Robertmurraya sp. FSL W8-0741]|uniref:phage tail sheath family protein n=1 Tax=Robertmurraya sp. FSL W8-0741 TaxID=2954629 RepID=UPI0030F8149A